MRFYRRLLIGVMGLLGAGGAFGQDIPIPFTLEREGYVTVVIEDEAGNRVRNLIQETFFPAGPQTIFWDGYDFGIPINRNRPDGNYDIERSLVAPGVYRVKALFHEGIDLRYEFSVQSPGTPPWHTFDNTGAWFSDQQSAWDVVWLPPGFVDQTDGPSILYTAKTGEAGHGIMLLDEDGRKLFGKQSLPGGFFSGHNVARDKGPNRNETIAAYIAVVLGSPTRLRLHRYLRGGGTPSQPMIYTVDSADDEQLKGLAVYNGVAAVSLHLMNRVVFLDEAKRTVVAEHDFDSPRGLFVTEDQQLFIVTGTQVRRFDADFATGTLTNETLIVGDGLVDPQNVFVSGGEVYVSDWGDSHQVKVFDLTGKLLRTIGEAGGPQIGAYDELRMAYPRGITVDSRGMLWVAERHKAPKRISRWDAATGAFDRAWYGPPKYGGGGMLDPKDPTRFYYAQSGKEHVKRTYEFALDWDAGTYSVKRILLDAEHFPTGDTLRFRGPEFVRYVGGRQYMANNNQEEPNGNSVCSIWLYEDERLWPAVSAGIVAEWDVILDLGDWQAFDNKARKVFFVWSDLNRDGYVQAGEVQYTRQSRFQGTCFVEPDLSITTIWGYKLPAPEIQANGIPLYDINAWTSAAPDLYGEDKDSYHLSNDSLFISFLGPLTFLNHGELVAQYHSQWPNRNVGGAPVPVEQYPGQVIATARPLGDIRAPGAGEAGPIFGINSDFGQAYVFTWDGYFVTKLLEDSRTHPLWRFDAGVIRRGDVIEGVSPNWEHFWPTLNGLDSGEFYYAAGKEHTSLLHLDGLDTIRRLDFGEITVTSDMLSGKASTRVDGLTLQERKEDTIHIRSKSPTADGAIVEWDNAAWLTLDAALGIEAALAVDDDSLYVAFRTDMPDLLNNSGAEGYETNFATGGGLDLWIGAPGADEARTEPVEGDFRIFVTREGADPTNGPLRATLFEQVRSDATDEEGQTYTSPIGTLTLDYVADVTESISFGQAEGDFEVAVPLALLGLTPDSGLTILGDVGVLIGDGVETRRRIYWNNKTNVIVSDLPSEAAFDPEYWGLLTFIPGGDPTGIAPGDGLVPERFSLEQNYPNPFSGATTIRYSLPRTAKVNLEVFDLLGRRVATLVKDEQPPGYYEVVWEAREASGVYLYRLRAGDFVDQKTALRVK